MNHETHLKSAAMKTSARRPALTVLNSFVVITRGVIALIGVTALVGCGSPASRPSANTPVPSAKTSTVPTEETLAGEAKDRNRRRSRAFADALFIAAGQQRETIDHWASLQPPFDGVMLPVVPIGSDGNLLRSVQAAPGAPGIALRHEGSGVSAAGVSTARGSYLQQLPQTPTHLRPGATPPALLIDYAAELPDDFRLLQGIAAALLWMPDVGMLGEASLGSELDLAIPPETHERLRETFPGLEIYTATHMTCIQFVVVHQGATYRLTARQRAFLRNSTRTGEVEVPTGTVKPNSTESMLLVHKDGAAKFPGWGDYRFRDSSAWTLIEGGLGAL